MTDTKTLHIDLGDRSYAIHIGGDLLTDAASLVPLDLSMRSVFVLTDDNVYDLHAKTLIKGLSAQAARVEYKIVPHGETSKSYTRLQDVLDWLLERKVDRTSVLFALGGGVMGDLGGFAASIIMRGIPYVQVPTTLLAMVDSSVGGKTGINTAQGKNLVGSFYQPVSVIADTQTLKTLPDREILAGYAEVMKYGLIDKPDFFDWLSDNKDKVLSLEPQALNHAIDVSCRAKAEIVSGDEREKGRRALLNLGHTFGHALESAAGYDGTLLHGEGVAIGMLMAYRLSVRMGLCSQEDADRVRAHVVEAGLPDVVPFKAEISPLMEAITRDKKAAAGAVAFVLARGIGKAFLSRDVDMDDVRAVMEEAL